MQTNPGPGYCHSLKTCQYTTVAYVHVEPWLSFCLLWQLTLRFWKRSSSTQWFPQTCGLKYKLLQWKINSFPCRLKNTLFTTSLNYIRVFFSSKNWTRLSSLLYFTKAVTSLVKMEDLVNIKVWFLPRDIKFLNSCVSSSSNIEKITGDVDPTRGTQLKAKIPSYFVPRSRPITLLTAR